jgi:hypothetical protein
VRARDVVTVEIFFHDQLAVLVKEDRMDIFPGAFQNTADDASGKLASERSVCHVADRNTIVQIDGRPVTIAARVVAAGRPRLCQRGRGRRNAVRHAPVEHAVLGIADDLAVFALERNQSASPIAQLIWPHLRQGVFGIHDDREDAPASNDFDRSVNTAFVGALIIGG